MEVATANNTVEQGRIHFSSFSKVFRLDEHFFDVLQWNIGQLLMFVMPIVFFLLAIKFGKKWIEYVNNGVRSIFRWLKNEYRKGGSSYSSFNDDSKFQKSNASKAEEYKESKSTSSEDYGYKERLARWRNRRFFQRRNDRYHNKYKF